MPLPKQSFMSLSHDRQQLSLQFCAVQLVTHFSMCHCNSVRNLKSTDTNVSARRCNAVMKCVWILNWWYCPTSGTFKNKPAFGFRLKWPSFLCRLESQCRLLEAGRGQCGGAEREMWWFSVSLLLSLYPNLSSFARIPWMGTSTAEGEESSHFAACGGPTPLASWLLSWCLQAYSHTIHLDLLEVNAPPLSPCASRDYCLYKETGRRMLISLDHCCVYIHVEIA